MVGLRSICLQTHAVQMHTQRTHSRKLHPQTGQWRANMNVFEKMFSLFFQDSEILRWISFVQFVTGMFLECKVVSDIRKGKWVSRKAV